MCALIEVLYFQLSFNYFVYLENDQGHVIAEAINRDQDQDLGIMKDILPINIIAQDHQGNANPHRLLAGLQCDGFMANMFNFNLKSLSCKYFN